MSGIDDGHLMNFLSCQLNSGLCMSHQAFNSSGKRLVWGRKLYDGGHCIISYCILQVGFSVTRVPFF
jgi:hypothetical protein